MRKFFNKWSRKLHRWGAIITLAPVGVIIGSGLFLQLKKESDWIQPPAAKGVDAGAPGDGMTLSLRDIFEAAKHAPEANLQSWDDVERLDVRPSKGIAKVRCHNSWEIQIDTTTGAILQAAYRRSDLIESIHDGSFFHNNAKLWIFLPSAGALFALWATGIYLWILPLWARRAGRKRRAAYATARLAAAKQDDE